MLSRGALALSDLGLILELGGAVGGNIITFVAPGVLYWLIFRPRQTAMTSTLWVAAAMFWIGVALVPLSVTLALAK